MTMEEVKLLLKCQSCQENGHDCDRAKTKPICEKCKQAGRECNKNQLSNYLREVKEVLQTLVPENSPKEWISIIVKTGMHHTFLAHELGALVALKKDNRSGGRDYEYAKEAKVKAWDAAAKHVADPREENSKALYIFAWIWPIIEIEASHRKPGFSFEFAIHVSRALMLHAKIYRGLVPFLKGLCQDDEFRHVVQVPTLNLGVTEAAFEGTDIARSIYRVIDSHGKNELKEGHVVTRGDCKKLAINFIKVLEEIRKHKRQSDPRAVLLWAANADLNEQFWLTLDVGKKTGLQHDLWLLLLANWSVACHLRRDLWFFRDVGRKIVEGTVGMLESDGLHIEPLWQEAMVQALGVIRRRW